MRRRVVAADMSLARFVLRRVFSVIERLESVDDGGCGRGAAYTWRAIESDHPYPPAATRVWEVRFSPSVVWLQVEFDARCGTVQPEDTLALYTDVALKDRIGPEYFGQPDDAKACWPASRVVIPGSSVFVVLQTASDYVNNANASRFGFALSITGHEMPGSAGVELIRRELARAAAVCLAQLMTPQLSVAVVAAPSSDILDAAAWSPDSVGVTLSKEGRVAESLSPEGLIRLNKSFSRGRVEWIISVVKETAGDQCITYGVCVPTHKVGKYKVEGVYVVRGASVAQRSRPSVCC